jgi:hypothetical protein
MDRTEWGTPTAGPLVPPPWPARDLVALALDLLNSGDAMVVPEQESQRDMIARWVSEEFKEALSALGGPYILPVRCRRRGCPGTLGRLLLDPGRGMAIVYDEPLRPKDRDVPRPWTKATVDGKGYREGPTTADANGTFSARCRICGREVQLGPESRTAGFLEALFDRRDAVFL